MDNALEDTRKKRDSTEVLNDDCTTQEEKAKKPRAHKAIRRTPRSSFTKDNDAGAAETNNEESAPISSGDNSKVAVPSEKSLDLESALHQIAVMGNGSREYVSKDTWVTFRVGHAGDASTLAACYRAVKGENKVEGNEKKKSKEGSSSSEESSLEVRLSEAFGDEHTTPPSVFALLADLRSEETESILGAAALLSLAWEEQARVLRVEWLYVKEDVAEDASVLERRMWLRLSALAVMTSCQMLSANETERKRNNPQKQEAA